MSASDASEHCPGTAAPRRTTGRITGGIVLILIAGVLLYGGIQAIVDPDAATANSSGTARSPDTAEEAALAGLLFCAFGISLLCLGIGLFRKKAPANTPPSNEVE